MNAIYQHDAKHNMACTLCSRNGRRKMDGAGEGEGV